MPTRLVREGIITSEPVNSLTWAEEVFYRRLHSVVDDFGRFSANPTLLRAACYPLRLNDVSDQDVGKWLAVCATKGLVRVYEVEGKRYLEVAKFNQVVRSKKSKCPDPPDTCIADAMHLHSRCTTNVHLDGDEDGDVKKHCRALPDDVKEKARSVLTYLNRKVGRAYRDVDANLSLIAARIREGASVEDCQAVIDRKHAEWGGGDMEKFLRPATLFNAQKFAQYQGETVETKVKVDL